jgi:hypothetical protein
MLAQQNPNCTDFELCFQKRVGAAGDTIIDVLLINPPDSIVGANFEVRMSAEAYGGQVFDVHSAFAAAGYSPTYIDNTFQDDVITFQRSVHLPILLSEDTVKLFSFTILAPAGVCIDLRFVDFARAFVSEDPGSPTECFPVTKCTANLCFPSVSIGGIILTLKESCTDTVTNNFGLRDIIVNVYQGSDTAPSCTKTTGSNGRYECILAPGYDYTFIPTPDDSVLVDTCGVNEVDILHIRQHILSISFLNHPYEIIAADASQDGMISTYDMVVLGGFLQGLWDLPKNWEIVEAGSYNALPDPIPAHLQPLGTVPPFDTSLTIINLPPIDPSPFNASFFGIKIGDVDRTCEDCYANGGAFAPDLVEERQAASPAAPQIFSVYVPEFLSVGALAYLPVHAEGFTERAVLGLQLWLSPDHFEVLGMRPGALPEMETAAMSKNADGRLGLTWFSLSPEGVTLEGSEPLFYLAVKLLAIPADWQAAIALQDRPGRNIMIDNAGEARPLALEVILPQAATAEGDLAVTPNPFRESLQIAVDALDSGPAEIALLDASGQVVARRSLRLESGTNLISLEGLGSLPPGFYTLRLVAESGERWQGKAIKF